MEFDISKLEKIASCKKGQVNVNLTVEEISFMSNIFNTIINFENYEDIIQYLAGINCMSISDIKFIRNVYYYYYASNDEKKIYNEKMKEVRKVKRKNGFIDFWTVFTGLVLIGVIGIILALYLYNL